MWIALPEHTIDDARFSTILNSKGVAHLQRNMPTSQRGNDIPMMSNMRRYTGGHGMTQNERIARHLKLFGKITSAEAMQDYGIMRLASRIHELKKMGFPIEKEMRKSMNRFGEPVTYAEYRWR